MAIELDTTTIIAGCAGAIAAAAAIAAAYLKGKITGMTTGYPAPPGSPPVHVPPYSGGTAVTPVSPTATTPGTITQLGFTVLPTQLAGKSPYLAEFTLIGSQLVTDYSIDFQDGTPKQTGAFYPAGEYRRADISHTFTYRKGGTQYGGHNFYPEITINGVNENGGKITNVFNTAQTGRSLTIYVYDPTAVYAIPTE